jgi:hypothetical protein
MRIQTTNRPPVRAAHRSGQEQIKLCGLHTASEESTPGQEQCAGCTPLLCNQLRDLLCRLHTARGKSHQLCRLHTARVKSHQLCRLNRREQ